MDAQRITTSKLPRFPMIFLGGSIIITLLTLIWITFNSYYVNQLLSSSIKNSILATELYGKILHDDEMLTMSAQMAAMTGNPQWENRYRQYETKLTTAINHAMLIIPHHLVADTIHKTDIANAKLVKIENHILPHSIY